MAFTANTYNLLPLPTEGNLWAVSLQIEDASGCEDVKAAETNKSHYITKLLVHTDSATDMDIGSGETTGAVTTVHWGTIPLNAASGRFLWEAPPGMGVKCTVSLALTCLASAGTLWIEAQGKTCAG